MHGDFAPSAKVGGGECGAGDPSGRARRTTCAVAMAAALTCTGATGAPRYTPMVAGSPSNTAAWVRLIGAIPPAAARKNWPELPTFWATSTCPILVLRPPNAGPGPPRPATAIGLRSGTAGTTLRPTAPAFVPGAPPTPGRPTRH